MTAEFCKKSTNSESTIMNTILHTNHCTINMEREAQHRYIHCQIHSHRFPWELDC